ncbi:MAG: zinc-binding dehydrogenase [Chloroflexi bacterium]|nr:zinc-binding dehydrogenase [Chloroflexota bacterium]
MKAAAFARYGPPEVVHIVDFDKPVPKANEALIKVHAASVNPIDCSQSRGAGRIATGFLKPTIARLGIDMAGEVEAIGSGVTQLNPGDEVFGACLRNPQGSALNVWVCQGAFAEYACAPESMLAKKPENVTFEEAATVPVASFTALQGLRDKGQIQPGQRVLINGAAGGVGTFAVQIAKSFQTEVTGVCSTRNLDLVRSFGADRVLDYTKQDFTKGGERYDIIFDCVGNHSLADCRRALNRTGTYVVVGDLTGRGAIGILGRLMTVLALSRVATRKVSTFLAKPVHQDLIAIRDLITAGKVKPIVDRRYTLSEVADALRYVEQRHARGKVVLVLS